MKLGLLTRTGRSTRNEKDEEVNGFRTKILNMHANTNVRCVFMYASR